MDVLSAWNTHRKTTWVLLAIFLPLVFINLYTVLTPPSPLPADAPSTEFSARRAFEVVQKAAAKSHPVGSLQNSEVRDLLVATLQSFGYDVSVEQDYDVRRDEIRAPQNIYALLRGTASTGTIVLTAHYDSVPYGPGAADDISGVATVIETARALKARGPMRNDILFFLSDGEEGGLLGAHLFAQKHTKAQGVRLFLNFEARGTKGPSMMFQTGPNNGVLIPALKRVAPYPVANSLMFDIANSMPTTTDFEVYRKAGSAGYDFAFLGNLKNYHTRNDSPENLSLRSLQHHGSYALSLAAYFGNEDLTTLEAPNWVYFNVFGHHLIAYPSAWTPWQIALTVLLFICAAFLAFRNRHVRLTRVVLVWVALLLTLVATIALNFIPIVFGALRFGPYLIYNHRWYTAGGVLITLTLVLSLFHFLGKRCRPSEAYFALGFLHLFVSAYLYANLPLGTYTILLPLAVATVAWLVYELFPEAPRSVLIALFFAAAWLPFSMHLPFVFIFLDTLTAALLAVAMCLLLSLFLFGALPSVLLAEILPKYTKRAMFVAGILCFLVAILDNHHSASRPKMSYLAYGYDADTEKHVWITQPGDLDEYIAPLFAQSQTAPITEFAPYDGRLYRIAAAAPLPISPGTIKFIRESRTEEFRRLEFQVQPARETAGFSVIVAPDVPVRGATFQGLAVGSGEPGKSAWTINYRGRCDNGLTFTLEVDPNYVGMPPITLIEHHYMTVPHDERLPLPPRPVHIIPMTNTMPEADVSWETLRTAKLFNILRFRGARDSTRIFVRKTHTFTVPPSNSLPEAPHESQGRQGA